MRKKCVIVADRARARVLSFDPTSTHGRATRLHEERDLVNPELQEHSNERFSHGRSEARSHTNGHAFSLDDHRESHDLESERKFAGRAVTEALAVAQSLGTTEIILIAEPKMLGLLRKATDENHELKGFEVKSLSKGLSKRPLGEIEEIILGEGLISARQ